MKRTGNCTKCSSRRVIKTSIVPDAGEWSGSGYSGPDGRSGGAHVPRVILVVKDGRVTGRTEVYACADCGWFEEYLAHPEGIDWSEVEGVWAAPEPPYR
jgi:DNA-directed RNA polymerase subunit RPC12/RpoP